MQLATRLKKLGACVEAIEWAIGLAADEPQPLTAWNMCPRGDWMLWLVGKFSGEPESEERKKLVLCACECARLALSNTEDARVAKCIETAELWANGSATIQEVRAAKNAAYVAAIAAADVAADAAYADTYDAAADGAHAAAYAAAYAAAVAASAAAAADVACAAYAAAYACAAATDAAYAAYDARMKMLAQCADIVRKHYPVPPE